MKLLNRRIEKHDVDGMRYTYTMDVKEINNSGHFTHYYVYLGCTMVAYNSTKEIALKTFLVDMSSDEFDEWSLNFDSLYSYMLSRYAGNVIVCATYQMHEKCNRILFRKISMNDTVSEISFAINMVTKQNKENRNYRILEAKDLQDIPFFASPDPDKPIYEKYLEVNELDYRSMDDMKDLYMMYKDELEDIE